MSKTLTTRAYVSDYIDVELVPDDDPDLCKWADERSFGPRDAVAMLQHTADRLKFISQFPSPQVDRLALSILETEIRDILSKVDPLPGDSS